MKRLFMMTTVAVGLALLFGGCSGGDQVAQQEYSQDEIAARVDDWVVTKEQVQDAIDQMPDYQQKEFNTDEGRARVADAFIQEELFYREALRNNLTDRDWVQRQIEDARRRILISAYFKEFVETEAKPTEEEIHDYYETNQHRYMNLAVARAQHIFSKNPEKLEDLKTRVLEGGEKFTTLATKYSEDDLTRADGGDMGYFNPGGYVRGFGYDHKMADSMFTMEPGKIYGPIKWEKGYSIIRVNEKRPAELRPYSDVRDEIVKTLIQEELEDAKARITEEIAKGYDVENKLEEYFLSVQRSPQELFNVAQAATDPKVKIRAYEEVVEKFPDHEFAPKALFMVGFVYAEEMQEYLLADRTFAQVIAKYPDTDIADQAKWMMENMKTGSPDFDKIERQVNEN